MDLEKLKRIKNDIELLKNGVDPQSRITITVDTILLSDYNQTLLDDVSKALYSCIELAKPKNPDKRLKQTFFLTEEAKKRVKVSDEAISVSAFTYRLNEEIESRIMKKLKATEITGWLCNKGYLKKAESEMGHSSMKVTIEGESVGILQETKMSDRGNTYSVNLYDAKAQNFILENLEKIVAYINGMRNNELF